MSAKKDLDKDKIPRHVVIIMDGNGRWAKKKGAARMFGHKRGVRTVREITEAASETGVEYLTLYVFSTENWNRPQAEVSALMALLVSTIADETEGLIKNNVKLKTIGELSRLPARVADELNGCISRTSTNTGLTLTLALNYGSQWEIIEAVKKAAAAVQSGEIAVADITGNVFNNFLSTAGMPDPELLIRTGGELRISNFMLWQIAYSELYFTEVLWPDFSKEHFYTALLDYQKRERRFGKTGDQLTINKK
ncbi:MAG: isoprenyl transferase [Cytophagaceae bacterium]|jgi:undecaprenyl diphosphate synthase|nr:isoprenyl transferase [Cytophagaceae bacterium]